MEQTRVKVSVTALAILAFVLSYFGHFELLFLLIAYAVIIDKSQPLAKMSFQALYLYLAYRVILLVIGWIFGFFGWIFNLFDAYRVMSGFAAVEGYISTIISLLFFVACLLAVIQIISKKTCNLPLIGPLADKTLGLINKKARTQPQYQPPVQPYQAQTPPAQPYQAQTPPAQPYQAPVPPVAPPTPPAPPKAPADSARPEPAAHAAWTCSCGHENQGNFCMKCGSPRPK